MHHTSTGIIQPKSFMGDIVGTINNTKYKLAKNGNEYFINDYYMKYFPEEQLFIIYKETIEYAKIWAWRDDNKIHQLLLSFNNHIYKSDHIKGLNIIKSRKNIIFYDYDQEHIFKFIKKHILSKSQYHVESNFEPEITFALSSIIILT